MLKIYGSLLCPDCVQCKNDLTAAGVEFEYLDFSENLGNLKAFLSIRDTDPQFVEIKERGSIGIPCILEEDGTVSLDWQKYM
jgi:glutaredoxin-related protein